MKTHEENKIYALLAHAGFTDEESEMIVNAIDDKNMDESDMEELLARIELTNV